MCGSGRSVSSVAFSLHDVGHLVIEISPVRQLSRGYVHGTCAQDNRSSADSHTWNVTRSNDFLLDYQVNNLGDMSCFIGSPIYIVDRDGLGSRWVHMFLTDKFDVDEHAGGS